MIIHNDKGSLERWLRVVQDIIGKPTQGLSLLDLCCGECTGTGRLKWKLHRGVDVNDWPARPKHVDFRCVAVSEALTLWPSDVCICSDGIEHLPHEHGLSLLNAMTRAAKLVIVFTPLGPWLVDEKATHPDVHKSGWLPEELEAMGWQTEVYPNWHPTLGVGAFFAHKGKLQL